MFSVQNRGTKAPDGCAEGWSMRDMADLAPPVDLSRSAETILSNQPAGWARSRIVPCMLPATFS